jgi:ABC-type branched-subunit amino acid transport system substrate-binding protein
MTSAHRKLSDGSLLRMFVRSSVAAIAVGLLTVTTGVGIAGAASGASSQGITSKTITIGQMADITGPIPGYFAGAEYGVAAWAAYVNSTGGIDGRKVVVDFKDSAFSCTAVTNGMKELSSSAFAIVGTFAVADACGLPIVKASPQVLNLPGIILDFPLASLPNVVQTVPNPPGNATSGYVWIKQKYGAAAVQEAGTLYPAANPAGAGYQRAAAESVGWKYVYQNGVGEAQTLFTSDILRMKSDNLKVVDINSLTVTQVTDFLNQAAQENYHPLAIIATSAYDATFFKLLTNPANASNVVVPLPAATFLGPNRFSVPEVKTMFKWVEKVKPGWPLDIYTLFAWLAGMNFQAAMSHISGTPTQQKLVAAAHKVTSFNGNGLIPMVNPAKGIPTNCTTIVGAKNGAFVRIAPQSGFDCSLGKFYLAPS